MTGFDALGAPQGNPAADVLLREAYEGEIPTGTRRRLWNDSALPDTGIVGSVLTGGGVTAAMGKGVVDAGLGLMRGLTWLGTAGQYDTSQMPQTIYDLLPEESANHLASRIARANIGGQTDILGADVGSAGELTGQIASLVAGGGLPGALGKGAGKGVDIGSKLAKPFTMPGQAIRALGFPGQKIGAKIASIPQVAQWTRTAKMLPEVLGGATGFGLYNFITQDGELEERAGAALHGAVAGGALSVLGRVATAAEAKLLDKMLSPDRLVGISKFGEKIRMGRWEGGLGKLLDAPDRIMARAVSTAIEGTGFAMLNEQFWDAALAGDTEKAAAIYVESLPAALLARTGRMDAWRDFRRSQPDLNDLNLRREIIQTRRGRAAQEEAPPQDPQPGERGQIVESVPKPKGVDRQMLLAEQAAEAGRQDPLAPVANPLLHSGWDIPDGVPSDGTIELRFPGGGEITLHETDGSISVPPSVFRIVRGDEAEIARSKELDTATQWAKRLIAKSYPRQHKDSMEMMAKQQIDIDIDVDQARALMNLSPEGSVMHQSLKDIVDADAPYGPVTLSGLELARTVNAWRSSGKDAKSDNSKRVNEWLNVAAEEVHRWALVSKHGEESIAGQVAQKAPRISLPAMVDEMIGGIIMEGPVAEEFARDLAAITMMRRMSGELRFGEEAWAGGPWKSGEGMVSSVGVDGKVYEKPYSGDDSSWVGKDAPPPEIGAQPQTPSQAQWLDFAKALRQTATPNPGLDLIETSVITAINGNPDSPSVSELNAFIEGVDAANLAEALTPANMERVGMLMGQVGSGHISAQDALLRLQEVMSAPPDASSGGVFGDLGTVTSEDAAKWDATEGERRRERARKLHEVEQWREKWQEETDEWKDWEHRRDMRAVLAREKVIAEETEVTDEGVTEKTGLASREDRFAEYMREWHEAYPQPKRYRTKEGAPPKPVREGEGGFIDVGGLVHGGAQIVKKGVRAAAKARDYFYETRAEELRRASPSDTVTFEGRTQLSRKRRIRGEAHHLFEPARQAVGKKVGMLGGAFKEGVVPSEPVTDIVIKGGAGRTQSPEKVRWDREMVPVGGGKGGVARWELLADKRRKPKDALEKQFQDSWQEAMLYLWNAARDAGMARVQMVDGKARPAPLPKRTTSVTQRFPGRDVAEVYDNHDLRKEWFQFLEELNPGDTTAEKLNDQHIKSQGGENKAADVDTALEHVRLLKTVPHTFTSSNGKTYEMRETDPRKVLSRIAEEQSAAIATAEVFGQDWTPAERNLIRQLIVPKTKSRALSTKTDGKAKPLSAQDKAALAALDRPGVNERIKRAVELAKDTGDFSVMTSRAYENALKQWFDIMQGRGAGEVDPLTKGVRALDAVPRSFMTAKAAIYDVGDFVAQPLLYAGLRRTLKALHRIFGGEMGLIEAIHYYERMGAISSKMTSLMYEDVRGLFGGAAKVVGLPGEWAERAKGAMFAAVADAMLESWSRWAGSGEQNRWMPKDAALLAEMGFTPREQSDLLSGQASEELRDKFRAEFVQWTSGRYEAGEGPRAADNPWITAWVRFIRIMSGLTGKMVHRAKLVFDSGKKHGWGSKATARALGRWFSMVSMRTVASGGAATLAGIALQQFLRGEPEEIMPRVHREIIDTPLAALWEMFLKQNVGGSAGVAVNALSTGVAEDAIRGLAAPADQAFAAWRLWQAVNSGDQSLTALATEAAKQFRYIPLKSDLSRAVPRLEDWVAAAIAGENTSLRTNAIADRDRAIEFLRGPGKDAGLLGLEKARTRFEPSKSSYFYDAMDRGMKAFWRGAANGGVEEGWKRAKPVFEKAVEQLEEKPESIAAWVRSQKVTSIIGNDKISDFWDYVGAEAMAGIADREQMLDHLASAIAKNIDGVPLPDWAERVEELRKMSAVGVGDWNPVVEEALENVAGQIKIAKGMRGVDTSYIREIAAIIASNPKLIGEVFKGEDGEYLQGRPASDYARTTKYVERLLLERADNRAAKAIEEQRK